ncbi:MAG: hypothetical protein R3C53_09145 [Pirellulaceae bacterium]
MLDWQTTTAILIVCVAAGLLARRVVQLIRSGGAGGCSSCPNSQTRDVIKTLPLVQLQPPKPDRRR